MELQWPLILFTFFNCVAAGVFLMLGVLNLLGRGKKMQLPSLIVSLVALAVGGISVFLHLQHWERIFNGFGHITSGITIELIAVVLFAVGLVLYFLMMRRSETGMAPKWCGALAIVVSLILPIAQGDSYLMPAIPVWDSIWLVAYYVVNTLVFGGFAALLIANVVKEDDAVVNRWCSIVGLVGAGACALVTLVYAVSISNMNSLYMDVQYYFDPTMPDGKMVDVNNITGAILSGSHAMQFWAGNIVVGCAIPLVLGIVAWMTKRKNAGTVASGNAAAATASSSMSILTIAAVALICAVVGSFVWRALIYVVGQSVIPYF